MAQEIKINCAECMKGNHEKCTHSNCLCREDKHGENLRNGAKVDDRYSSPKNEPREYEQALHDMERLEDFEDNGLGNNSPQYALIEYTKLLIYVKHMVSKLDIESVLKSWCLNHRIDVREMEMAIDIVWAEPEVFTQVKKIAKCLGSKNKVTLFDKDQLIEVAEWLKGRYQIKRIEVTGDLLFWNDQYYENDAEALIRRNARSLFCKSKNGDMNEVVKYIEDTCNVITWRDIEKSIHIKALLNGTYNIKTGIFSPKFDPDYIILNQIPHKYDCDQSFSEINGLVTQLIPDNRSKQSFYDFLSTCYHPYTGVDYQFGLLGGAGTGKSQLGVLAELAIGEDNTGNAAIHLIAKDQTTQKNMAFKMLNIDYDLSNESIQQVDVLKEWITQDKRSARGIYEQNSTFRPMSRLLFMANDLYEITNEDDAEAIYDRTYIIRVDKKYRHQETEIKQIMRKTATESQLDGFVTYLLNNATEIFKNESYHYPINLSTVESIWNTYGNRIKMFTEKWIERGVSFRTESSEPYNKWMNYCIQNNFKPKDKKQFSKIFNEIIGNTPTRTRIDNVECNAYTGFRIKTDEEIADSETIKMPGTDMMASAQSLLKKYFAIQKEPTKEELIKLLESELD